MRRIVAVVGDAFIDPNGKKFEMAYNTAKLLVDAGFRIQSGGLYGVMEAAFKGARASKKYKEGDTIAILPSFDINMSNGCADIVIPTGLDIFRNIIVANAAAVVAVGGGSGTLCEMTSAWTMKRLIVAFDNVDGWSSKLANTRIDARVRYPKIEDDKVYGVSTPEDAVKIITERVHLYDVFHQGIHDTDRK